MKCMASAGFCLHGASPRPGPWFLAALVWLLWHPVLHGEEPSAENASDPSVAKPASLAELKPQAKEAIERAVPLLQQSAATYIRERECFSCHHQALPSMAMTLAEKHGFPIDAKLAQGQLEFTRDYFQPRAEKLLQGTGVIGGPYTAGYALGSLAMAAWPADDTTAALAQYLVKVQEENGRWRMRTRRPPLEVSDFTSTALAVRGLQTYVPECKGDDDSRALHETAVAKARAWLEQSSPETNEDFTFRLLGLQWAGAEEALLKKARDALLARQQPDGGWEQEPGLGSDAYATGQALVALRWGGALPAGHKAFRKGAEFLLRTQKADGSWEVVTRSKPIQVYFESGFPHGKNQFISISGAAWATMALLLAE